VRTFDDVTGRQVNVGEEGSSRTPSVLGACSDMSTPSGVNIVRQHVGDVGGATWDADRSQHALGGIPRAAREGQAHLYAPLTRW